MDEQGNYLPSWVKVDKNRPGDGPLGKFKLHLINGKFQEVDSIHRDAERIAGQVGGEVLPEGEF
jgi:hypothetical protein